MKYEERDKLYPFSTRCPYCRRATDGLVHASACLGGGGPFEEKLTGTVLHTCTHCKETMGLKLRLIKGRVEVLDCDDGAIMTIMDMAEAIEKKDLEKKKNTLHD